MTGRYDHDAQHDYPAVVLDLSANGIGVIRSLKRRGIPVYGFDIPSKYRIGRTRWAVCGVCPHPVYEEAQLVQFLLERGRAFPNRAVLYAGSDDYVAFVSRNREVLADCYRFLLPDPGLIEAVLDKRLTHELAQRHGIEGPKTFVIDDDDEMEEQLAVIPFPCLLKPVFSSDYRKRLNKKAMVIHDREQFRRDYPYYRQFGELLIQELIPGNESCLIGVATLFDSQMQLVGVFSGKKIHQYPPYFGSGTLAISYRDDEAIARTVSWFRALQFTGLAKIEFKRDPRDNQLKFIEINARTWFWNSLAARCGVDFSYLYYLVVTHQHPEPITAQRDGIKWVYVIRDVLAFVTKWRDGKMTLRQWVRNLSGEKEYALFQCGDPMPSIRSALFHLKQIGKNR